MATIPRVTPCFFAGITPVLACLFCVTSSLLVHAEDTPVARKIGAEFKQVMQAEAGFTWSDRSLREGLGNVAKECGIAIWLDRRVDPDRRVTFSARNLPLESCLRELATSLELSYGTIGSVVYIGPADAAARLQGLLQLRRKELAALPTATRARWLAPCSITWNDLSEPRELIQQVAEKLNATCVGPEKVPHDLWLAWRGPTLTGMELVSLLLIGFERTIEISEDGRRFAIIPAPELISYEETYPITGDVVQVGKDLKKILPDVQLKREGTSKIAITASAENHAKIVDLLAGKKVVTNVVAKPADKRYTLKVENQPRGAVVKTIATEMGMELKFMPEITERLQQRVSLSVKQVTAEELLRQLLAPAGLVAKIEKNTLQIIATEP